MFDRSTIDIIMNTPGMAIAVNIGGGMVVMASDVEDVFKYINDSDQYSADFRGVTKEHYQMWIKKNDNYGKCQALTKKGLSCSNFALGQFKYPQYIDPIEDIYCSVHSSVNNGR